MFTVVVSSKHANVSHEISNVESVFFDDLSGGITRITNQNVNELMNINPPTTPLINAVGEGDLKKIELLLQMGADVEQKDSEGKTAFIAAACEDNIEVMQYLIDKNLNPNINAQDDRGQTPLIHAAFNENKEMVELLCNLDGILLNLKDKYEYTALMYAHENENQDIVNILKEHGAAE